MRLWEQLHQPSNRWTGAQNTRHTGFKDRDLYKLPTDSGTAFDAQYFRVNSYGPERYALSVTNSLYHRLVPDESGFERLTLAGDWTRCGLNAGCVEAATMSGIAAAHARRSRATALELRARTENPKNL